MQAQVLCGLPVSMGTYRLSTQQSQTLVVGALLLLALLRIEIRFKYMLVYI